MLYKKNKSEVLSKELFENPTEEYRAAPFWAWNCKVTPELIKKQIGYLKEMGFGGYHIHSRTGMDVPYLSDEFMSLIKICLEEAKKTNTLAWLYDEDRWPSGAAGGLVTKNPKFRARFLRFSKNDCHADLKIKDEAIKEGTSYLYNCYDIVLNDLGELVSYKIIDPSANAEGDKWFTYICPQDFSGWYNNQTYADTLSKEAIDKFIEITHERYKECVGKDFDDRIPAIFTDEPQFSRKGTLTFAKSDKDVCLPWTILLPEMYGERYNEDIAKTLPELIWEKQHGEISKSRYLYHDCICQLFTEAFADNCGKWCEKNGISMTGHMMEEPTLHSQTAALGEAMRSYRNFQIPGIDILCSRYEYTTAKQSQSAAHQYGREGVLSELYGVTNWDFDFRGHKLQGDWQAALGITVRVPHLAWMSMYGEAKRDYPASINYQSPWYKEYSYVEDHFARLNTALTRGKPSVDIGVIHPIESYWLHWGPSENTGSIRSQLEGNFQNITEWLLFSQLDFDFISESLLPEQFCGIENKKLVCGKMKYKTILVPGLETMRETTLKILSEFLEEGGKIIFIGNAPMYIDACKSNAANLLYNKCKTIQFSRDELLSVLEDDRSVELRNASGNLCDNLLYNMRIDSNCSWLFIARGKNAPKEYLPPEYLTIKVNGIYIPKNYDTVNGVIKDVNYSIENGKTVINYTLYAHDSLLLQLNNCNEKTDLKTAPLKNPEQIKLIKTIITKKKVEYTLSEENALLLDMAEYSVDGGAQLEKEEILRLNNNAAKIAGIPPYNGAQPWVEAPEILSHFVDLKFVINSEIEIDDAFLAIENAPLCEISLNGKLAKKDIYGYFVDESIKKIALPKIKIGENILLVKTPIGIRTKIEWCYIIGNFNVRLEGCDATLVAKTSQIGYSDITSQGLPFYTGNVTYREEFECDECKLVVKISEYKGALVRVFLDGHDMGIIAYDPYKLDLGKVSCGKHTIEYKLFGTRYNAFGALHNTDNGELWAGPNLWRTSGDKWCYEYRLRNMGILSSPVIAMYQ